MGTGWRKAFCSTIPKEREKERPTHHHHHQHQQQKQEVAAVDVLPNPSPSPKGSTKLSLFSSISNPSTPRLRVRTTTVDKPTSSGPSPKFQRKVGSNPSSPRSPFAILKNTLRLTKNGCGLCMQSVKTGQGMAIYTAECSHTFHFPCIVAHVRSQGCLICPVCNLTWKDVPLLSVHKNNHSSDSQSQSQSASEVIVDKNIITSSSKNSSTMSAPTTPTGSNRIHYEDKRLLSLKKSAYNDDEPLLSKSPRFNPIPEEAEEFQGFVVTPRSRKQPPSSPTTSGSKCSIDPYNSVDKKSARTVEVKLLPEAAVVSGSRSHETFAVALRVKAPPTAAATHHRTPIDLVTVLDVSGSMSGPKLLMLKRAMRLVVSSLTSADRLSIVVFSSAPQRLMPLRRMTTQAHKSARKIIDHLTCGQGGTSTAQALRVAAKVLDDRRQKNPVCTIILLSDGQDDLPAAANQTQRASTRFAHIEIPVHPSGFGFRTHEPKPEPEAQQQDAFAKCVGGLLSVVVKDLRVQLGFSSGSAPAEIMAVYSCNGRPSLMSPDSARLGDLYAEEERELLIELKMPISAIGSHHVMSVRCTYKDPVTQEVMYGRERALLVPRPHAIRSSDPKIELLRCLFVYTRAVAESRRLVEHYDFNSAHHLLSSARALVLHTASAEEYAKGLECELEHLQWRRQQYQAQLDQEAAIVVTQMVDKNNQPTSACRGAEQQPKITRFNKSLNRSVSDLHGFEYARF